MIGTYDHLLLSARGCKGGDRKVVQVMARVGVVIDV